MNSHQLLLSLTLAAMFMGCGTEEENGNTLTIVNNATANNSIANNTNSATANSATANNTPANNTTVNNTTPTNDITVPSHDFTCPNEVTPGGDAADDPHLTRAKWTAALQKHWDDWHRKRAPVKEFVNGEGFPHRGRTYRLKLVDDQDAPLKLLNGRFCLRRELADRGRDRFIAWYASHASAWLTKRVEEWAKRMGLCVSNVVIQAPGFHWGSCSASGAVNLHWATILLPASVVDYVIVHELAHLIEPNHTPRFWAQVEKTMFDFAERKAWLAERGHGLLL